MITRPPPLASSSELQCDVPEGQFETGFAQIHILIVQRGEWSDRWTSTERVDVTNKFGLKDNSGPVSNLKPATNVRLVLDAIGIIFTTSVLSQPNVLSPAD